MAVAFAVWAAVGCWTDIASRRLPNWWVALGFGGLVVSLWLVDAPGVGLRALCGGAAWLVLYAGSFFAVPGSMGAGDVKLAAVCGGVVGATSPDLVSAAGATMLAAFVSNVYTLALAMALSVWKRGMVPARRKRAGRAVRHSLPHGPAMLLAVATVAGA
nr:A24 family peptidase [Corynebacterium lactis]